MLYAIGELHGRGLVAMACEIKTYEILFCGLIGQICENFPLYGSTFSRYGLPIQTFGDVSVIHCNCTSDFSVQTYVKTLGGHISN